MTALRTGKELDALPDGAVVYDHSCQVWQKLTAKTMSHESLRWFKPGDGNGYHVLKVQLPARLLSGLDDRPAPVHCCNGCPHPDHGGEFPS